MYNDTIEVLKAREASKLKLPSDERESFIQKVELLLQVLSRLRKIRVDPFLHLIHIAEIFFRANIDKAMLPYSFDVA